MVSFRRLTAEDFFHCNAINLDVFTETFAHQFYVSYLNRWPQLCIAAETADGQIAGYIIGKVEGVGLDWHGHVTALSVAPDFRRVGLAKRLMNELERISEEDFSCYFVDLFVRESNRAAVSFYRKLGYIVWRRVENYYSHGEAAFDMRMPLRHDPQRFSVKGAVDTELPAAGKVGAEVVASS